MATPCGLRDKDRGDPRARAGPQAAHRHRTRLRQPGAQPRRRRRVRLPARQVQAGLPGDRAAQEHHQTLAAIIGVAGGSQIDL
jgi:hypothetical protein